MVTARPLSPSSEAPKLASVDSVIELFGGADYVCGKDVATAVYLMTQLQRPLLVEDPGGRQNGTGEGAGRYHRARGLFACSVTRAG